MPNILVVAAHPDDEVFGVGGTIARHVDRGDSVNVMYYFHGVNCNSDTQEIADLSEVYGEGFVQYPGYGWPDQRSDTLPIIDIIRGIERVIEHVNPDTVYTHCPGDPNWEHRRVFEATAAAARPKPGSSVRRVLGYEIPSYRETGLRPSVFSDISGEMEVKWAACCEYYQRVKFAPASPLSWDSIKSAARVRGAAAGLEYAEAFELIWERW